MDIRVDAIQSMTDVMSISQIQQATVHDEHLQCLKNIIISGRLDTKDQLHFDIRPNWSYKDNLVDIDGIVMKGRHIIIPKVLKQQVLDQLHVNHMGIKNQNCLHASLYIWLTLTMT